MLVLQKYGTREQFLTTMNPTIQAVAAKHPDRCFFGDAPTLGILKKAYGDNMAVMWLVPQLDDLIAFTNSRQLMNMEQTRFVADAIAQEYGWLKTSELLLFFYRFKLGYYGRFYGTVDPMIITTAIHSFLKERNEAYDKRKKEEEQREREEYAKTAITAEQYCELRGLPKMTMSELLEYNATHD